MDLPEEDLGDTDLQAVDMCLLPRLRIRAICITSWRPRRPATALRVAFQGVVCGVIAPQRSCGSCLQAPSSLFLASDPLERNANAMR